MWRPLCVNRVDVRTSVKSNRLGGVCLNRFGNVSPFVSDAPTAQFAAILSNAGARSIGFTAIPTATLKQYGARAVGAIAQFWLFARHWFPEDLERR
ncbi:hypothetical protein SFHH103_04206 (plasmid) [Sinorhizobium fredii HH103]|uniref:Uncharacterized protein n=1 Tax=Sinorhizobium fredii (strain HH103) TaxID=1117943 RepID=G9ACB6_SINF1|nr:hypothetical protein SFHH103_04206 [Sinorhizobium fredii HH103]